MCMYMYGSLWCQQLERQEWLNCLLLLLKNNWNGVAPWVTELVSLESEDLEWLRVWIPADFNRHLNTIWGQTLPLISQYCHTIIWTYIQDMKGSCTSSFVLCFIRGLNYFMSLRETEDSDPEGSFHITVFLTEIYYESWNLKSDVVTYSSCLHWEEYIQLSKFDPLCGKKNIYS